MTIGNGIENTGGKEVKILGSQSIVRIFYGNIEITRNHERNREYRAQNCIGESSEGVKILMALQA